MKKIISFFAVLMFFSATLLAEVRINVSGGFAFDTYSTAADFHGYDVTGKVDIGIAKGFEGVIDFEYQHFTSNTDFYNNVILIGAGLQYNWQFGETIAFRPNVIAGYKLDKNNISYYANDATNSAFFCELNLMVAKKVLNSFEIIVDTGFCFSDFLKPVNIDLGASISF